MYVDSCKTGKYRRHLLRDSYRENGQVKHHTVANLSQCSAAEIRAIRLALQHKDQLETLLRASGAAAPASPPVELHQGLAVGAV